jgi:hypothetical protein
MKYICRYPAMLVCFIAAVLLLNACSKIDAYKEKYVSQGEITYIGKIDSVSMRSGKNRVKFKALLNTDPRVIYYRVYWGGRADSITFQVNSSGSGGKVEQVVGNVPEGEQTFEFVTFDALGNKSVSTFKNGTTYGARYEASLLNRTVSGSALNPNLETAVSLISMDKATGAFITEIRYINAAGDSVSAKIPLTVKDTFLLAHKYGSEFIYRTWYQPDSTCIDTFYTPYTKYQPVSGATWIDLASKLVKNYGAPFQRASWDGSRWGILADWTSSADVKNTSGGNGGYELRGGVGVLSMEAGWGLPAVPNGKIYQVVKLPYAGKWRFTVPIDDLSATGTKYIAVNLGTTMPDFANITTATYYYNFSTVAVGAKPTIEFTAAAPMDVCIGFVATMPNTGTYFKVKTLSLSYYKE